MDNTSCIRQQADIKQINRCKERVSELHGLFDYLSNGLELTGNNVRLKILFLLFEEKRLCVCDLSDILGMTISAISQHLRKLKDRKLIETEREAQTIFYSLTKEYEKMLEPFFKVLDDKTIDFLDLPRNQHWFICTFDNEYIENFRQHRTKIV